MSKTKIFNTLRLFRITIPSEIGTYNGKFVRELVCYSCPHCMSLRKSMKKQNSIFRCVMIIFYPKIYLYIIHFGIREVEIIKHFATQKKNLSLSPNSGYLYENSQDHISRLDCEFDHHLSQILSAMDQPQLSAGNGQQSE